MEYIKKEIDNKQKLIEHLDNNAVSDNTKMAFAIYIKHLHDTTGAGLMLCKKAFQACGGDLDKAVKYIEEHSGAIPYIKYGVIPDDEDE